MPREGIILRCDVCKHENYISTRNKKTQTEKLELTKFCASCNKHTLHKERK